MSMPVTSVRYRNGAAATSASENSPSQYPEGPTTLSNCVRTGATSCGLCDGGLGVGRAGAEATGGAEAQRLRLDLEEGGTEGEREAVEHHVHAGAGGRVGRVQVIAALAVGQVAQDRLRLRQHQVAVLERGDAHQRD